MDHIGCDIKSVIRKAGNCTLLKITSRTEIGGRVYVGTRYEIWTDNEKMAQGIYGDDGYIYYRGFAGESEESVIRVFNGITKYDLL